VCCSVLQCVAVCCSVLQCVAVFCIALQCAALRLHCVAVCCSVSQFVAECRGVVAVCYSISCAHKLQEQNEKSSMSLLASYCHSCEGW